MSEGPYERDVLVWSERQAGLLRRLAAGERVNDAVDWANVIEEVRDVGGSALPACRSLLRQALLHLLKLHAWPDSASAAHWRDKVRAFLGVAEDCFTPSIRQHLDLGRAYGKALYLARATTDGSGTARALPEACPFSSDDLLAA